MNLWDGVTGLVGEIKKCEGAGSNMGALTLCYVAIDTMAQLAMPDDKQAQTRSDFIDWVNTYLKGHKNQPYQYRGIDVYAARCAVLHSYGTEAALHQQDDTIKKFGYHDGGKHMLDEKVDKQLVLIGLASFINDVVHAVGAFLKACGTDEALRKRAEARLPKVLAHFPIPCDAKPKREGA